MTPASPHRAPRTARRAATAVLALALAIGAAACAPQGPDVPSYASATRDDPEFNRTFRHEFATVAACGCTT
ncbi:hypothetical protein [Streptomyces sp. DASNCL29]|uniref:hypothetical protein n=1 Tax=Streptomyces sp. DASNCL29 TaxID=2583819 RepID=UPI0019CF9915|nr:hypothetical protein [Streptomyces sp. DASNCL29]